MDRPALRVLVVDDQADCLTATVKFLEIFGYAARGAGSGASALAAVAASAPDVVVLDLGLPDMDGFSLLDRLRESATAPDVVFIAMSGRCDEATRQRADAAGISDYLVKPVDPEALMASINRACELRGPEAGRPRDGHFEPPSAPAPKRESQKTMDESSKVSTAAVELERDLFMRTLIGELSGTLTEVIGLDEAAGFISVVGQRMGAEIDESYRRALGREKLDAREVGQVLVDLKRRINGDFYLIEQDEERIVLGNRACPFAEKVNGRPALCMMTSNVFGSITAANLGYAKVELQETIARGASGCRIVVYLRPTEEAEQAAGHEYYGNVGAD